VAETEKTEVVEDPKEQDAQQEVDEASADELETPVTEQPPVLKDEPPSVQESNTNTNGHGTAEKINGHGHTPRSTEPAEQKTADPSPSSSSSTTAKLEAMSAEREALRQEVEQLRRQLETISASHTDEVSQLRTDLEESEAAKDHAETQYQNLLGRVEKIKQTLGDRLKRDKAELDEANQRVEELETANEELKNAAEESKSGRRTLEDEVERLKSEMAEQGRELAGLRSRNNLSQQNWSKEKDDLSRQTAHLKQELEATAAAMGEWEVIAMEERSMRESLSDKVTDLEEQVGSLREAYERAVNERDTHSQAVDGLQRALQEIQEARKKELREMVESSESQVAELKKRAQEAEEKASTAEADKEKLVKELERTVPFEKEVKEKNLLIGKLRHEAIVLNDHLTKALKYIKKMKPEEMIDRYVSSPTFACI
jgi:chromosome segregation ATPase